MRPPTWLHRSLFALLLALPAAAATTNPPPNILFLVVDDLRPELGCYGKSYIHSPCIDALARTGMVFDRAYCQQAVCSPSRTAVMTGTRPDTSRVWDLQTHFRVALPDVVTLPQAFMARGYVTQGMGKIFHGGLNDAPSWTIPWTVPKAVVYALPDNVAVSPLKIEGEPDAPARAKGKKKRAAAAADGEEAPGSRGPAYECADVPDNTYQDGKVADLAVRTLRTLREKNAPFFLAVGFIKPHLPWVAPKKYWDLYDPAQIALAPNPFPAHGAPAYAVNANDGEIRHYHGIPAEGPFSDELARKLKHAYFAGVSYTDAQVGRVLAELDRLGLRQNTIVILWGDHGWKLGEHGAWGKHTNVENDVNAPLILSVPGMSNAGKHSSALVEFVDIYPTLCELAGVPLPAHLEGASFTPLLADPLRPWKTAAFSQYPRGQKGGLMGYSMRTDRYRFTVWVARDHHDQVDATELYDHQTDPGENTNLAADPAHAELVRDLMRQWRQGWPAARPPVAAAR